MTLIRPLMLALLLLANAVAGFAQSEQAGKSTAASEPTVTAFTTGERVRFTAPAAVVLMRLEVYNSAGKKIFDNELRGGNVLDWHLQDGQAERLPDGSYLCVVTTKSLSGRMNQKLGKITIENAAANIQPIDLTQLTAQQTQAVGPVEENASITVLKEGDMETPTVIAHNGDEGQITRGKGALSFRMGDFYSGKDTEQMRLTVEGNLGIGITHPQVKLDVDGVIRASQGIVFPDGTTQYSAASKTLGAKSTFPDQKSGGKEKFHIEAAGTGTQNRIAKWTDNAGTLGDSVITETAGGLLGIGTPTPDSLINIQGTIPALLGHMSVIRTTGANNGFGLLMDAAGSGNNNLGLAVGGVQKAAFSWDNSRNFLGFVNFNYSVNDFSLRVNANGSLTYHDGASSVERFRITKDGNVGIGITNPLVKLDVAGDIQVSGNIAAKYQDVAEWVPARRILPAGTVVSLDVTRINTVTSSTRAYDPHIAGVVSSQPGLILGESGDGKLLVATSGRVKVKVDASRRPIKIGDLLVASHRPGMAMKSEPFRVSDRLIHRPGTILGKALEPLAKGQGEILVLLSLQ